VAISGSVGYKQKIIHIDVKANAPQVRKGTAALMHRRLTRGRSSANRDVRSNTDGGKRLGAVASGTYGFSFGKARNTGFRASGAKS